MNAIDVFFTTVIGAVAFSAAVGVLMLILMWTPVALLVIPPFLLASFVIGDLIVGVVTDRDDI